jgi:mannose-1-phosphate guanylyltransferase
MNLWFNEFIVKIKQVDEQADITIATSQSQVSSIKNQLGNLVSLCVEPCRRDTFPAIALASLYLSDMKHIDKNEPVVVCPVDPYVDVSFFAKIKELTDIVKNDETHLALLGVSPTYPSEKFGYIIPMNGEKSSFVSHFKEKPNQELAQSYIENGALWNSGVFAFQLSYLLDIVKNQYHINSYQQLVQKYDHFPKISFDYAVVEKEKSIQMLRYFGQWKDIGTWNTLSEVMDSSSFGRVIVGEDCTDTHVINTLNVPVLCMGTKDLIVATCKDGVLISTKSHSSKIKKYVESVRQQTMYAEKSWGEFTVLDAQDDSLTIKLAIKKGKEFRYHCHVNRDEVWTILSGRGYALIEGKKIELNSGVTINIPKGSYHMIKAEEQLSVIEVQTGVIDVEDKNIQK